MSNREPVCIACGKPLVESEDLVCINCLVTGGPAVPIKNIHIENSYNTWLIDSMNTKIHIECYKTYGSIYADQILNRTYKDMYIEWYLHNIGYWLTLPFIKNEKIKALNERFKHVDLEQH